MRTFNEHITHEQDEAIRAKLEEVILKSLSFKPLKFKVVGTSRQDVLKYIHRTEKDITYGFSFFLNLGKPAEVAKWITEIDSLMIKLFGKNTARNERIVGSDSYVETGKESSDKVGIDGKDTRIRLPIVEYWYDPNIVEESTIYSSVKDLNKFNL